MARRVALFVAAFLLVSAFFVLVPAVDRAASALFYRPGEGFFLADWPPFRAAYLGIPYLVDAIILGVPAVALAAMLRGRPLLGLDRRAAAYLLLSLAFGPGLVVNTVFKDHWGRARPAQTVEFGGDKRFTPAFVPSRECQRNCSFPAGHPAVAFYLVSFAFLVPAPRRRRVAEACAIGLGAAVGVARMAQGGHFLSDVVASGFFVYAASWLLHVWIIRRDGLLTLMRHARRPPAAARRLALWTLLAAVAVALSVAAVDRPLALYCRDLPASVHAVFRFITRFGQSTGYLVLSAAIFLGCRIAARRACPATAVRLAGHAWRAAFVFAAVAVPGLVADLMKPIFGRARPKLLFADNFYGFTWNGSQADYWSFPSGHTVTIVGLAVALYLLWPRGLPAYAAAALLVAASRIIIGAHYLGDVIAGAYVAAVVTLALWAAFARAGVFVPRAAAQPASLPQR
jgi:lipid A 4'-phosphatase